jgi:hypothetical protein
MSEYDEELIVRFHGGPRDGATWRTSVARAGWPLPEVARPAGATGEYVKVRESELPPQGPDSHLIRGAEYEWKESQS